MRIDEPGWGVRGWACTAVAAALGLFSVAPLAANDESRALRQQGYAFAYNLDHDKAMEAFRRAVDADPEDAAAYRAVANISWLNLLFRRGSVSVDDYLGSLTKPNLELKKPPPDLDELFRTNIAKSLELAERHLRLRGTDPDAHYNVGAAVGQMAAYTATVEGRVFSGFTAARRAFDEHERVLQLDPARKDAGLIVGTYRYVVANLSLIKRWMAYLVGFGGNQERAIDMLKACSDYPGDDQVGCQLGLVLIYNREERWDEALALLEQMRAAYPRNRLLWLEAGATALRAGRPADALPLLNEGLEHCARDDRPRAFGEEGLWHYKRGATLVALQRREAAEQDLRRAMEAEARDWVRGRVHTELGKLADLAGDRPGARASYRKALSLGRLDNDPLGVKEAEALLDRPYRGTKVPANRQ
ncbi:MAG: tetratricopeptide repeat protein [Acidobacteriota bacterium]